jgi:hypothetical protein
MKRQADLNCGWYCTKAMLAYWFERLSSRTHDSIPLQKTTVLGYHPKFDNVEIFKNDLRSADKPTGQGAPMQWERWLRIFGPVMVSGKLGAADWGRIGNVRFGVGHWVLIVGIDIASGTISYKDPLQGDALKTKSFAHVDARIEGKVYWLDQAGATKVLCRLNAH